jgi:hypothetical protein
MRLLFLPFDLIKSGIERIKEAIKKKSITVKIQDEN